jgi:serine/threonine-protein kinase
LAVAREAERWQLAMIVSARMPRAIERQPQKLLDLAKGGMGTVELSLRRDGEFRRVCAVKRLHPHLVEDDDVRAMFVDEARVAGLVRHANVVSVLDVGDDARGPFLVMDYIEGLDLATILKHHHGRGELLPLQICTKIIAQAAHGLEAAHSLKQADGAPLGLVHRDVSPQNVLVGFDGVVRITDFGIARAVGRSSKLTAVGLVKGKTGYVSPEQLRYEEADARSDLFALGVVLFELCSGRRLYQDVNGAPAAPRILTEPPPDLGDERDDVPPALTELIFTLLAKDRDDRPASAAEVARRLEAISADLEREEETISIADYVGKVFDGARREAAERLADAMKQADLATSSADHEAVSVAKTIDAAPKASSGRRSLALLGGGAIVIGAAIASIVIPTRGRGEVAAPEAAPTMSAPLALTSAAAPSTIKGTADPGSIASSSIAVAPAASASSSAPEASSSAKATAAASARGVRPRPQATSGIPMWGWK